MNKAPFKVKLYLILSIILDPIYFLYQNIAILRKKEEKKWLLERWVNKGVKRPKGQLIWVHVASVGEALSTFPLIQKILGDLPDTNVLVTSTTKTSAKLLKNYDDDRVIHQMSPFDTFFVSNRFLNHWKPDLAFRVESEIWPRILVEIKKREVPNYLFNARFSIKTIERMKNDIISAKYLLSLFDQIHVPEKQSEQLLFELGLKPDKIFITGDLKDSREALQFDTSLVKEFSQVIDNRNVWLAANTHRGEDEIVLHAHKKIGGILIIVPRHIERAVEIMSLCSSNGLTCQLRSEYANLQKNTDVYVADTMGEMGLWYSLVKIAFIGGSLVEKGGHNPVEAAQLGVVTLHGPFIFNSRAKYEKFNSDEISYEICNAEEIVERFNSLSAKDLLTKANRAKNISRVNKVAVDESFKAIKNSLLS